MNVTTAKGAIRKPLLPGLSRYMSALHRWAGIGLCLIIALWFVSGSVLSFVPFPSLSIAERVARSEPIDTSLLRVEPKSALLTEGASFIESARLINVQRQPRYVLTLPGQPALSVSAETGQPLPLLSRSVARAVGSEFAGLELEALQGPFDYDQWVVHRAYDAYRPFYKVSLRDAAGTQLYVSARTGEVLQRTRRSERAWNYVGAVAHWISPTFLRKRDSRWREVVWTLALSGIVLTLAGIFLGVLRYVNLKRQRRPGLSPFRGWLRWHHSTGLFVGVLVFGGILSGWLGLDGIFFFSNDQPSVERIERMRGISLTDAAGAFPLSLIQRLGTAREITFTAIAAQPLLLLRNQGAGSLQVVSTETDLASMKIDAVVPDALLLSAVQRAWPSLQVLRMEHVTATDAYSLRSSPFPPTTRRLVLSDTTGTWIHMDAATGEVISIMDTSRRVRRWVVDGMHTFDLPLLNRAGPLWHVLLLVATSAGLLFSCTGIALALRRLRRNLLRI